MVFSRFFKSKKPDPPPVKEDPRCGAPPAPAEAEPAKIFTPEEIREAVIEELRTVYDPEIPANIYEMGLIYDIDVDASGKVIIQMTLTSPGCPVAGSLVPEVESKARMVPGVSHARAVLVWDPPWDPSRMSDAAKLQLGFL
jgi:FeS assembly SUF system protein